MTESQQSKDPLNTLIALDIGFACLMENIKNMDPTMAKSLAIDLTQSADKLPLHLPESTHPAGDVLRHWAAVLNEQPRHQSPGTQN